jgi:chromosome segregation ATPase
MLSTRTDMMTKSFHKLPLTILAITMILSPQAHAEATDSSRICATYTADFKHLNKSLLIKQKLLEEYQKDFQLLQEKLLNISSFYDSINQQEEKLNVLKIELGASDQTAITIYNKKVDSYNKALKRYRNDIDTWNSDLFPNENQYAYKSDTIEKSLKVLQSSINSEEESISRLEGYVMQDCVVKAERG